VFIRDGETDAAVRVLEDIAAVMCIEPRQHDVAALHQPDSPRRRLAHHVVQNAGHGRPGGIHQDARCFLSATFQREMPHAGHMPGAKASRARADVRSTRGGVARVQHHQTRVIHPTIGILEAARELRAQRRASRIRTQIQRARARQDLPSTKMVVQEQPQPDQPPWPQARVMRQHEAHRTDDVRCGAQQHLAFCQRLAHQAEGVVLQIA